MITGSPRSFIDFDSGTIVATGFGRVDLSHVRGSGRFRDVTGFRTHTGNPAALWNGCEGALERTAPKLAAVLYQLAVVEWTASPVRGDS